MDILKSKNESQYNDKQGKTIVIGPSKLLVSKLNKIEFYLKIFKTQTINKCRTYAYLGGHFRNISKSDQ